MIKVCLQNYCGGEMKFYYGNEFETNMKHALSGRSFVIIFEWLIAYGKRADLE